MDIAAELVTLGGARSPSKGRRSLRLSTRRVDSKRHRQVAALFVLALFATSAAPFAVAGPSCEKAATPPPRDDREGAYLQFEEPLVHPIEITADGRELWVANPASATVAVFDLADPLAPRLLDEIPVGLGPVSVRERRLASNPQRTEIWVVCSTSNAVFVLDRPRRRLLATIRAAFGPSGLVFSPDGALALVALTASNQILRLDAHSRRPLTHHPFAAPYRAASQPGSAPLVGAVEPRALAIHGDDLYALSARSGNGTALDVADADGDGVLFEVLDTWRALTTSRDGPPPDRDVLRFSVADPAGHGTAALWRMGTLGNDLALGPEGELWVANVDLANARYFGKFAHRKNAFARHLLSHARPSTDGTPQRRTAHLDLNFDRDRRLPPDYACAAPTALLFTQDLQRLYVACGETRNVAVVDPRAGRVIGELRVDLSSPRGWGPRGLALDERKRVLYVFHRDQTISIFRTDSADGAVGFPVGPPLSAGFDPTPEAIHAGRRLFTDARRSRSRLVSCNTCHTDGRSDGLAWDLRDFSGDFTVDLDRGALPRFENTIRVTQDLRAAAMTPPYHWRGDRKDLADFEPAFEGLLDGPRLNHEQIAELSAYLFSLALPPNPRQDLRRRLSPAAEVGWDCFSTIPSHAVSNAVKGFPSHGPNGGDPTGRLSVTCRDCHAMDGGLGTNNQIINEVRFPVPQDTTHLLGLADKRRDEVEYAGARRPVTGWGFGSTGMFATIFDFIGMFPEVPLAERQAITAFVDEFDAGLAPAAGVAATLGTDERLPDGADGLDPIHDVLLPAARAQEIELIVRGWLRASGTADSPNERNQSLLYDPSSDRFLGSAGERLTLDALTVAVGNGGGVLAFLGAPRGMGRRLTGDPQFLDEGEQRPARISNAQVVWVASTVAKIRFRSDRRERYRLRVVAGDGPRSEIWRGEQLVADREHAEIVRGLEPDRRYEIEIVPLTASESSAGSPLPNDATATLAFHTQPHLFRSVHVARTFANLVEPSPTGKARIQARFRVVDERGRAVERAVVHFQLFEWRSGAPFHQGRLGAKPNTTSVRKLSTAPSVNGWAELVVETSFDAGSGARAEIVVDTAFDRGIEEPEGRLSFHPMSHEFGAWAAVTL